MEKGKILAVIMLCFSIFAAALASAELFVSQGETLYNVGDSFSANVTIVPMTNSNDFLSVRLACLSEAESSEAEIYKVPMSINYGQQKVVHVSGSFENFLIGGLIGKCVLKAFYAGESAAGREFEITRALNVNVLTNDIIFDPGSRIDISGTAAKSDGRASSGFVEISIPELGMNAYGAVIGGKFNFSFSIPDNAPSRLYSVNVKAYERDVSGRVTNEGSSSRSMRVRQVVKKMAVALGAQEAAPESEMLYSVVLYDQADEEARSEVAVELVNPAGNVELSTIASSGEAYNLTIGSNYTPGYWKIKAKAGGLEGEKEFYVETLEKVSFKLAEGILSITNTGNVPYKKAVEILIGGVSESKEIELEVGETKKFVLSAPDGEYSIEAVEGENREALGKTFLTGHAISVDDAEKGWLSGSYSLILWIILIGVAMLLAVYNYDRIAKWAYTARAPKENWTSIKTSGDGVIKSDGLVSEGVREECAVVSLRIKSMQDIENARGSAYDAVERALSRARDAKAKIYSDGNFKTMIFSPSVTKDAESHMRAVRIAKNIERTLLEHNARFGEKVSFGIGVHGGEMIVQPGGNNFKINSIGNTIPAVKKIAENSQNSVGVSDHSHRRVLGKIKVDRDASGNFWRLRKVLDREEHSDFINRFINKQKEDSRNRK